MTVRRLRKFLRLPATERWLLAKSGVLLEVISLGMWLLPFQTLRRLLTRVARIPVGLRHADQDPTESVVWAVETAGRRLHGGKTCLTQALAAQILLNRRGRPATLHIGAVKDERGEFLAHAWVESEGRVVIGGHELERYTKLMILEWGSLSAF